MILLVIVLWSLVDRTTVSQHEVCQLAAELRAHHVLVPLPAGCGG